MMTRPPPPPWPRASALRERSRIEEYACGYDGVEGGSEGCGIGRRGMTSRRGNAEAAARREGWRGSERWELVLSTLSLYKSSLNKGEAGLRVEHSAMEAREQAGFVEEGS
jgi:hypothetical protein